MEMTTMTSHNMVAILVMALVSLIIGKIWHSSSLFSSQTCCGSKEECHSCSPLCFIYGFLALCIMGYFLSYFLHAAQANTIVDGAIVGFQCWLGFIAPSMFISKILHQRKNFKMFCVATGYYLVITILMGAVLAVWN